MSAPCPSAEAQAGATVCCPGRPDAVRAALGRLMDALASAFADESVRAAAELLLAEVLNNVVEHAGASDSPCAIRIAAMPQDGSVEFVVTDDGRAMPGGRPPEHPLPPVSTAKAALPEGGFGWPLIRSLAREIHYSRQAGRNELRLRLDAAPAACPENAAITPNTGQNAGR